MSCTVPINPNPLPEDVPLAQRPQACNDYMRFFEQSQVPALSTLATNTCNIDTLLTFNNFKGDGTTTTTTPDPLDRRYDNKDVVRVGTDYFVSQMDNNPLTTDATGIVVNVPGTSSWELLPSFAGNDSGSNANGYWVKFSDGTLMQYGVTYHTINSTSFNYVILPIPYIDTNYSVSIGFGTNAVVGADGDWWDNRHLITCSMYSETTINTISRTVVAVGGNVLWTTIGRWK